MKKYNVAVVGATGLVGQTFLKVLEEYNFPINELRLLASERSEGKKVMYAGLEYTVHTLKETSFEGIDIALFSAGSSTSKIYAPYAEAAGAIVIDNSSCFREDKDKALVVPEVNLEDVKISKIIANPNCSTIAAIIPLKALDSVYGLKRIVYSTYQACSGAGMKGKNDLENTRHGLKPSHFPYDISKTCIPEIDVFLDNGYTKEEMKMVNETRKMLHKPDLPISATCVRVPVDNSHAVSVMVELEKQFELDEIRKLFASYPGVKLLDDPNNHIYPVATIANGTDDVYVGRIRRDLSVNNGLLFWVVADNVRKGAASNAVQIAKAMIEKNLI